MDIELSMFIKAALVLLAVLLIVFIVAKIFQSIFFGVVVAIVVAIAFTVFFGDGTGLIHYFASFMDEDVGTKIEQGYDYYKRKEQETPLLDADKVTEEASHVFESAVQKGKETFLKP